MENSEKYMVSVETARALLKENIHPLSSRNIQLSQALNCTLATDVFSPSTIPPFRQSAMDGYAIRYDDLFSIDGITLKGEIPAGNFHDEIMSEGTAVRIFTGAPLPEGADTVVEQERVEVINDSLTVRTEGLKPGANIRDAGSQVQSGELALDRGTLLTPGAIAYLASCGIDKVEVSPQPRVSIIVTGDELQEPGSTLRKGMIYESNSYALNAALRQMSIQPVSCSIVPDKLEEIRKVFGKALRNSDVIIFTGGISVGDYDMIRVLLEEEEAEQLFYKIRQKPGKPMWFGRKENVILFALPGNPASVLTCFYEYVYPSLQRMTGKINCGLPVKFRKLKNAYSKKSGMTHFLKGKIEDKYVQILEGQESYKLNSLAKADCLIIIEESVTTKVEGDEVMTHEFPHYVPGVLAEFTNSGSAIFNHTGG